MVNIVVGVNNMKITEAMKDRNSVHTPTEVEQVTTDTLNFTQGPKIPRRLFHKMCIFKKKLRRVFCKHLFQMEQPSGVPLIS